MIVVADEFRGVFLYVFVVVDYEVFRVVVFGVGDVGIEVAVYVALVFKAIGVGRVGGYVDVGVEVVAVGDVGRVVVGRVVVV